MFIAISKYKKPLNEVDLYRDKHRAYINPYFSDGTLLAGGRQNPPVGGIIISKKSSREQFEAILRNDPYVLENIAEYQIFEFSPILWNKCLEDVLGA